VREWDLVMLLGLLDYVGGYRGRLYLAAIYVSSRGRCALCFLLRRRGCA
jgi:hypothetical protein